MSQKCDIDSCEIKESMRNVCHGLFHLRMDGTAWQILTSFKVLSAMEL